MEWRTCPSGPDAQKSVTLKRLTAPAYLGVLLAAAGCAGAPCGGADFGHSSPEYAGAYSAAFHAPTSGSNPPDLAFTLAIDAVGQIAGTVTEAETSRTAPVTGRLIDWEFPCSSDKTLIEVEFSFESEALRKLSGSRAKGFVQPWPFQVEYELGLSRIGGGVLTLAKQ